MSLSHKDLQKIRTNDRIQNWKPQSRILYWSKQKQTWLKGKILEINERVVYVQIKEQQDNDTYNNEYVDEKKNEYEYCEDDGQKDSEQRPRPKRNSLLQTTIKFEINSPLIQLDDISFYKRKLRRNQSVLVWSREELRYQQGTITNIADDYVYIECGPQSRYIHKDSILIKCQ